MTDVGQRAADLMAAGNTKFRAKKALLAEGMSEEEANLAVEEGYELYQRTRRKSRLLRRFGGLFIMLTGLGLTVYFLFFFSDTIYIVVGLFLIMAIAGLVAVIEPDTLENFSDWFRG